MYNALQSIHSYFAYLALILLIIAVGNALLGYFGKKEFIEKDRKLSLYAMIGTHVQLIIGIILLFISPYWTSAMELGIGDVMGNKLLRLNIVEHPTTNIIAIILITLGWSRHKRTDVSTRKFRIIVFLYLAGLLLLLSRIPWSNWLS